VDQITAKQKENFLIRVGKREIQIRNIQVVGENIYLRFTKEDVKGMTDSLEVYVNVLKDQYGNLLNKRNPIEVYQYRELFVLNFIKSTSLNNKSTNPVLSSFKDTIPFTERKVKYWMNTPGIH
jgi:hypothetical protein